MPEEALLWRIVPAVSFAGHRAAKLVVFNEFNKFAAGIMAALVAVDHSLCMERDAMFPHQNIHRVLNMMSPNLNVSANDKMKENAEEKM